MNKHIIIPNYITIGGKMLEVNKIHQGDCLNVLKELPDNSVDSIVTDPPYNLSSIKKRFGKENSAPAKYGKDGSFSRLSKGFMGKEWDNEVAFMPELWKECFRVLKAGGYLLSFGGTRTYHRMTCAIEDAGFEVRDMIEWVYGSGFPKSLNIGKAVDKLQGNEREKYIDEDFIKRNPKDNSDGVFESGLKDGIDGAKRTKGTSKWEGWGTALKPAHEPICMARKPLAEKTVAENCLKWGTGGINIDESRVGCDLDKEDLSRGRQSNGGAIFGSTNKEIKIEANNLGRFPANLIHDNSEEVRECFPEQKSGVRSSKHKIGNEENEMFNHGIYGKYKAKNYDDVPASSGNASRFFKSIIYTAKASKSERNMGCEELELKKSGCIEARNRESGKGQFEGDTPMGKNNHPTVKPIKLMEYLIKMVTPKDGIVLDPFAGSGTTLVSSKKNGFRYIGIEMTEEYIPIINARLNTVKQESLFK